MQPKDISRVQRGSLLVPVGVVAEADCFRLVTDKTKEDPAMDLPQGGGVRTVAQAVRDGGGEKFEKDLSTASKSSVIFDRKRDKIYAIVFAGFTMFLDLSPFGVFVSGIGSGAGKGDGGVLEGVDDGDIDGNGLGLGGIFRNKDVSRDGLVAAIADGSLEDWIPSGATTLLINNISNSVVAARESSTMFARGGVITKIIARDFAKGTWLIIFAKDGQPKAGGDKEAEFVGG